MKNLRLTEEQLADIQKKFGNDKTKTHLFPGVDIDRVHRKYRNKPTLVDGVTFHSKKEARRYEALKVLQAAGKLRELKHQVRFDLRVKGFLVCAYIADFCYIEDEKQVVEDTKGVRTEVYQIKKKLMKAVHGLEILET